MRKIGKLGVLAITTLLLPAMTAQAMTLTSSDAGVLRNRKGDPVAAGNETRRQGPAEDPAKELGDLEADLAEDSMSIRAAVTNKSTTDVGYLFIALTYNKAIYDLEEGIVDEEQVEPSGQWVELELKEEGDLRTVTYAYAGENEGKGCVMLPVDRSECAIFPGVLTVVAGDLSHYSNADMEVSMNGYGIAAIVSREGPESAWEDYKAGGNQSLKEKLDSRS